MSIEILELAAILAAAGIVAGLLAGLLGVGGGIVLVPVLDLAFGAAGVPDHLRMHLAVGTSLASIIPTALSSARAHRRRDAIDASVARTWSVGVALGATLGAVIAALVRGAVLSAVFGVVAVLVGLRMLAGDGGVNAPDRLPGKLKWLPIPLGIGTISAMMGIGGGTLSVPALTALGTPATPPIVMQTVGQVTLMLSDNPAQNVLIKTLTGAMIQIGEAGIVISNGKGASISLVGPSVIVNGGALAVT